MLTLFKLGSKDYSNRILNDTFAVQNDLLYNEWTDGNYTTHKDLLRSKVSGSFTMQFRKLSEYEEFVKLLKNGRTTEGYNICTIHCNNTNETKVANLFISITSTLHQKENLVFDYGEVVIDVGEA